MLHKDNSNCLLSLKGQHALPLLSKLLPHLHYTRYYLTPTVHKL